MKKLARYMKPYMFYFMMAPIFKAVEAFAELLQPRIMTTTIDMGVVAGNMGVIWHNGLLMLGVAIMGILGGAGASWFAARSSQGFAAGLREAVFRKVQSFSFSDLDRFSTGSLITRLTNDILQLETTSLMMQRIMVRAPLLCIGAIVMTMTIDARVAWILLLMVLVLLGLLLVIMSRAFPLFGQVQQRLDAVNCSMQENLSGMRTVKSFVRADYEVERFDAVNERLYSIAVAAGRTMAASQPLVLLGMNLATLLILWKGGQLVSGREMQIGQLMAILQYASQIIFSLSMLGFLLINLVRAQASAHRVIEVLDVEPSISDSRADSSLSMDPRVAHGEVEFRNVSFSYPGAGGTPVLSEVSFHLAPGETLGILGGTGAGKSTLAYLIPRLYDTTCGQVLIDGLDVREYGLDELRKGVGMVLQDAVLFSGTIRENLQWGAPDASKESLERASEAAQAVEFILKMPQGYDSVIGQRGAGLSGGQCQRLSIARALVKDPPILIFDDATSAVDFRTEVLMRQALSRQRQGKTSIIIAQRVTSVMHADRILILENGRISAMGSHRELLECSPAYQELCQLQLGMEAM